MKYVIPKLKAVGAKVVVQIEPVPKYSKGGIEIPDAEVRRQQDSITEGIIVGLGSTAFNFVKKNEVPQIGDLVTFAKYSGPEIQREGNYYRILLDVDVHSTEKQENTDD